MSELPFMDRPKTIFSFVKYLLGLLSSRMLSTEVFSPCFRNQLELSATFVQSFHHLILHIYAHMTNYIIVQVAHPQMLCVTILNLYGEGFWGELSLVSLPEACLVDIVWKGLKKSDMWNKQRLKASHAFYFKAETCDIFDISSAAFSAVLQFRLT